MVGSFGRFRTLAEIKGRRWPMGSSETVGKRGGGVFGAGSGKKRARELQNRRCVEGEIRCGNKQNRKILNDARRLDDTATASDQHHSNARTGIRQ